MKIAIIYASKHNFTEKCVQELSQKLEGSVEVFNLTKLKPAQMSEYNSIIIGSPIYMGQVMPAIRKFCSDNLEILKTKKVGLFLCGLSDKDKIATEYAQFYPEGLIASASTKAVFGGAITIKNMSLFEKIIIRIVTKSSKDMINLLEDEIDNFILAMNKVDK